jgi:esterase/lipase
MPASREFFTTTSARLSEITEPTLVVHSRNDPVSDYQTAVTISEQVLSSQTKLVPFTESHHILLRDYDADETIQAILDFASSTANDRQ